MLMMVLLSHDGDDVVEAMLAVARCHCRVMLATVLPSHAGDDAARVTWPRPNINAELYWRWCCRVMLATALPWQLCRDAM
jgi:hypothetical protein